MKPVEYDIVRAVGQAVLIPENQLSTHGSEALTGHRDAVGVAFVLLSGIGVIFLPTTAKFAYLDGSNVMTVAFARGIVAAILLALIALALRQSLRLPRSLLAPSLVAGIGQVCFVYGVYASIQWINISLALLILYLYPVVLAAHQHFFAGARVNPAQWLCALIACAGLALILGLRFEQISLLGIAFALLGMLAAVVITITNVRVTEQVGSMTSNFYMSLWSLIVFSVALLLLGEYAAPQSVFGWSALIGNGIAFCVAWVGFFAGARILGATRASMLSLVEPVGAAIGAYLLFDETYTLPQWFGFFVVLAALYQFEKRARHPA